MDATSPETAARRSPALIPLSATAVVLLAMSFGLFAGYLDLGVMVFKRLFVNQEGAYRSARDFPWTVPTGHAILLVIPGLLVVIANWIRPKPLSPRMVAWLFATLAIWGAFLRLPMDATCRVILALGLGRAISALVVSWGPQSRRVRSIQASLVGLLIVLAAVSSGRQMLGESLAVAGLPPAPPGGRNVVLIVWDTVRSYNLSLSGYQRETTPQLKKWAQQGVTYQLALAPAPWTYPSHSCFFTGQWPFELNTQWKFRLDTPNPTLAEYLASRGYQTAGFAANTNCCTYESGLARGFAHYEDYSLTPWSLLSRTVPGKWLLEELLSLSDFFDRKWVGLQSRSAHEINGAFLNWLGRRRPDRPFFAFLNYFDAHEPYLPPSDYCGQFGIRPVFPRDFEFLVDFVGTVKDNLTWRDIMMARDCYDDCIAYLDEQLGRLLESLRSQGLLENTDVIITSDHGEAFGEHLYFGHSYSVLLNEIGVPLVILSPRAPAGRVVNSPVSLRDLPATVVDLLGLSAGSPFPGRSLAAYWASAPEEESEITTPALSEQADATAFQSRPPGSENSGFQMSLVASGHHYIRSGTGMEQLFDLKRDPYEQVNLMRHSEGEQRVPVYRKKLLELLTDNPGSVEAEASYLRDYRKSLEALLRQSTATATSRSRPDATAGRTHKPARPAG